jgi:glyoxylase-like metal-dependent hydrolase (beta-lactamase superfamily II)
MVETSKGQGGTVTFHHLSPVRVLPLLVVACFGVACGAPSKPSANTQASAATPAPPPGPPPGIGRRDNATTLGPFGAGPLVLRSHLSAEYSATVNSWMLETPTEVALVDAQLVMPEAQKVVALVKSTGKKLAWVWITHGHPDHYAGLEVIARAFPDTPLYSRPVTAEDAPTLLKKYDAPLQRFFPGEIGAAVPLTPYTLPTISVGGVEVRIVDLQGGEHTSTTILVIPSLRAALTGDLVYNRVHPWLNEMDHKGVLEHVDRMATKMPEVDTFYPGHGEPFGRDFLPAFRTYVADFLSLVPKATDSTDLINQMWRRYPTWRTMAGLRFSAKAYIDARTPAPAR